jgi:hypothetical protein
MRPYIRNLDLARKIDPFRLMRIDCNTKTDRFMLCADRCVLRKKSIVKRIMKAMHLTVETTDLMTGSH